MEEKEKYMVTVQMDEKTYKEYMIWLEKKELEEKNRKFLQTEKVILIKIND